MKQFPSALRRYLVVVWALGLLAWSSSWFLGFDERALSWPLMAVLLGLLIVTQRLPQHVLRGIKLSLDTIPLFVAVLCLPLSAAVNMALVGAAVAQILRRRPWHEIGFNAAVTTLEVFVGGMIYTGLMHAAGSWSTSIAALIGAAIFYLVNSSLVAGAVAFQHHLTYHHIWREMSVAGLFDQSLMFLIGGLLALPFAWKPVAAALLAAMLVTHFLKTGRQTSTV